VPVAEAHALAALAEEQRRAGDAEVALRTAQDAIELDPLLPAARAAAALALLDLGRDDDARRQMLSLVSVEAEVDAPLAALDDGELERAFDAASAEREAMHDATEVAFEAMREAELLAPEGDPAAPGSPFRTRTMAALLERQGDRDAARAIRDSLPQSAPPRTGRRKDDVLGTLERWLGRLRRGDA
jgi:hypothetical protein